MEITRTLRPSGSITARIGVTRGGEFYVYKRVPWWQWLPKQRPEFIWLFIKGHISAWLSEHLIKYVGGLVAISETRVRIFDRETMTCYDKGVVRKNRVVTDAFVNLVVDACDTGASPALDLFNFGGFGTATTAEAAGQTALTTELTTQYATDNTRPTGTISQPSANIYRQVSTLVPDANVVIEEWAPFTQAATGGGSMMDRSLTGTQTINSGNTLEITYSLTFTSGG